MMFVVRRLEEIWQTMGLLVRVVVLAGACTSLRVFQYWVESAALQLPIAKRVTPLATAQTDNALDGSSQSFSFHQSWRGCKCTQSLRAWSRQVRV